MNQGDRVRTLKPLWHPLDMTVDKKTQVCIVAGAVGTICTIAGSGFVSVEFEMTPGLEILVHVRDLELVEVTS